MVFMRWIFGLPIAAVITAGLFAMMAGFIQRDGGPLPPATDTVDLEIFARERPEGFKPEKEPLKLTEKQPDIVIPPAPAGRKPGPIVSPPDASPTKIEPGKGIGQMGAPVIKHAPPYPEGCRSRAAEGVVLVQFDVTPEGNVVNPQVIESADRCFNRTVIRTVSKWKYPPAYQNGRPVMRYGVIEQFSFQLVE